MFLICSTKKGHILTSFELFDDTRTGSLLGDDHDGSNKAKEGAGQFGEAISR